MCVSLVSQGQILPSQEKQMEKLDFNNHESNLNLQKIEEIFLKHFNLELGHYKCAKTDTQVSLIKNSVGKFVRGETLQINNRRVLSINFSLNLSSEDYKKYKRKYEPEIGFFNFKFSEYTEESGKQTRISYFSEVNFDEQYQAYGLFNVIFNTYNATLEELNTDIDYLHVKSQKPFTASLYGKKGYEFTPGTVEIIQGAFTDVPTYLEDSSVSYYSADHIEMVRNLSGQRQVKTSISDLEMLLGQC